MSRTTSRPPPAQVMADAGAFNDREIRADREKVTSPDCGLVLTRTQLAPSYKLSYAVGEWRHRCRRPDLDGPVWCLIQRDGNWPEQ
jgi:hypothetical protein